MMWALLIFSLFCLVTPFFGIGVAGLIASGLLSLLFRTADRGVEQMSGAATSGNTGLAGCWLWLVSAFVTVGGVVVLALALAIAGGLRP
jgi:hypothetical protein